MKTKAMYNLDNLDNLDPLKNIRSEKLSTGMVRYFQYHLKLVIAEEHPFILKELLTLGKKLKNPFPYGDTQKIYDEFKDYFSEEDCINADLNTYWMTIVASHNYIINGKSNEIYNKNLIKLLKLSFFDYFDQYKFLEANIEKYPNFYSEYLIHEKTRIYLLYYLFLKKTYRYRMR